MVCRIYCCTGVWCIFRKDINEVNSRMELSRDVNMWNCGKNLRGVMFYTNLCPSDNSKFVREV